MSIREIIAQELITAFQTIPEIKKVVRSQIYALSDIDLIKSVDRPFLSVVAGKQKDTFYADNRFSGSPADVLTSTISFLITLYYRHAEAGAISTATDDTSFDGVSSIWATRIQKAYYSSDFSQAALDCVLDIEKQPLDLNIKPTLIRPDSGFIQFEATVAVTYTLDKL